MHVNAGRLASLALLALLAGPARAAADPAACRGLLDATGFGQAVEVQSIEAVGTDGCLFHTLNLEAGPRFSYRATSLLVRGIPFGAAPGPLPTVSLQVELRGIVFSPMTGSAKTDWLLNQQQVPFDLTLDGSYDAPAKRVVLRSLVADGASFGHVSISGEVDRVALSLQLSTSSNVEVEKARLRSLRLDFDSRRALATLALPLFIAVLPDDKPDEAVVQGKRAAIETMRTLLTGLSAAGVDALAGFVGDFPNPQHGLSLSVSADPPVELADLAAQADTPLAALRGLLPRLKGTATYAAPLP